MAVSVPESALEAAKAISPAYEWKTSVDATRYTKAIAVVKVADLATDLIVIRDEVNGASMTFAFDTRFFPLRTKTAVTAAAAYAVYYLY